jgi:glutathione S-transferase
MFISLTQYFYYFLLSFPSIIKNYIEIVSGGVKLLGAAAGANSQYAKLEAVLANQENISGSFLVGDAITVVDFHLFVSGMKKE